MPKTLAIVTGATGSGKTELAIQLAESLQTEIISADSRQIYRGIPIGTAAPTAEELARVKHHFIGILNLDEYYSAAKYEEDVLTLLDTLWQKYDYVVMCGGSMMYIDAITNGIDELHEINPLYLESCDLNNHRRLVHAIEITLQAGVPYSSLRTGKKKQRPFKIVKFAIDHTREELFNRINRRVDTMIAAGLEEEAKSVYPIRHYNSLNTVGYKELFAMMDGIMDRDTTIARIAKNTRVYAKKQLLWLSKDPNLIRLNPHQPLLPQALEHLKSV